MEGYVGKHNQKTAKTQYSKGRFYDTNEWNRLFDL